MGIQALGLPYLILILFTGLFSLIFYKAELLGKEKGKAIMRETYSERKAWGMIAFTAGSCRIPYITDSNTKLLPCGAADVVSKGFEEDSGIWWVSNRPGDVLSQWLWPYPSGSRWLKNAQISA